MLTRVWARALDMNVPQPTSVSTRTRAINAAVMLDSTLSITDALISTSARPMTVDAQPTVPARITREHSCVNAFKKASVTTT